MKSLRLNPKYPFPELLPLLIIKHKPRKYQQIVNWLAETTEKNPEAQQEYINLVPVYVYARCPLCQQACAEPIDTYSLPLTELKFDAYGPFPRDYPQAYPVPCKHYIGNQSFLNLHENFPTEMNEIVSIMSGEVPYVTPWLLVDEPDSYAVLHALPVCRIEDKAFVPKYTHFILTYFSDQPRRLIDQVYASQAHNIDEVHRYFLAYPYMFGDVNSDLPSRDMDFVSHASREPYIMQYNLQHWATKGKLGYLDYTTWNMPLKIGADLQLPSTYSNILGRRYRFFWDPRNGKYF